jgi:DNA-binding PucR family transcriptional regulator
VESRIHRQAPTSTRPAGAMSGRLTELLAAIDRRSALAFVEEQIGVVLGYDQEHGSDLADQLEQALDELASQPLGRPTMPRPLAPGVMQALELLNADLDRPSDRLALHLALKLHKMHTRPARRP